MISRVGLIRPRKFSCHGEWVVLGRTRLRNGRLKAIKANHSSSSLTGTSSPWMMIPALSIPNSRQPAKAEEVSKSRTIILAHSTDIRIDNKREFLRRWIRFFRNWIENFWNLILVGTRTAGVVVRLSPLVILSPAAILSRSTPLSNLTWRYTISTLQSLGPVAVKFAQWIATRRDIFPPALCDRLSVLHDHGYPHAWSHTHQTLIEAFGNYESKGLEVSKDDSIGCGSAAQVYRGTLTTRDAKTGEKVKRLVAIKVLHPKFQQQVDRDLKLIQTLANFLHSLPTNYIQMLNLPRATETFGSVLCQQADLTIEANNLRQFRSNFHHESKEREQRSSITFPRPIDGWTSPKVIVEEFHDAQPISNFLKDSSPEGIEIRKELAGPLLRAFLKMLFMDNFVHSDLHPGNVLVKTTTVPKAQGDDWWKFSTFGGSSERSKDEVMKRSIVFLDAGISTSLSPDDQRNLRDLFKAIIFNEGNQAGRLMVERAKYERCEDIDAFARGVEDIVSEFHDRRKAGLTLGAVRIGGLLSRVLDLCRIHRVEIDPAMASVVISTLVLEGLGRSLSPELNLIDFARPFVLGRGTV